MRNGADVLVEALSHFGVRHLFGMPGSHSTTIYDAIARRPGLIDTVLIRNEQAGAFAADGYASDRPPRHRLHDRRPGRDQCALRCRGMLGRFGSDPAGRGPGQRGDARSRSRQLPRNRPRGHLRARDEMVRDGARLEQIPEFVAAAFQAMTTGRPRPAALFLPQDLMRSACAGSIRPLDFKSTAPSPPPAGAITQAAELLASAARPIILAGGALLVSAARAIESLAARLGAPVVTTLNGKGLLDERHPLSLGHARSARAKERFSARRRDARRRLPLHRSDDRLAAHDGPRQPDSDRSRREPDRRELPGSPGNRGRRPIGGRSDFRGPSADAHERRLGIVMGCGPLCPPGPARVADRYAEGRLAQRCSRLHRRLRDRLSHAYRLDLARTASFLLPVKFYHARLGLSRCAGAAVALAAGR